MELQIKNQKKEEEWEGKEETAEGWGAKALRQLRGAGTWAGEGRGGGVQCP